MQPGKSVAWGRVEAGLAARDLANDPRTSSQRVRSLLRSPAAAAENFVDCGPVRHNNRRALAGSFLAYIVPRTGKLTTRERTTF